MSWTPTQRRSAFPLPTWGEWSCARDWSDDTICPTAALNLHFAGRLCRVSHRTRAAAERHCKRLNRRA